MEDMKVHPNGGGKVAITAKVDPSAFVGENATVYGNAVIDGTCILQDNAIVEGNSILVNGTVVSDDAVIRGTTFLSAATIHSEVILEKTPIVITGFEQQIVVSDNYIIVGCQAIKVSDWENKSIALLRANGYPKASAIRIRDSIDVVRSCYKSLYAEQDLISQYTVRGG